MAADPTYRHFKTKPLPAFSDQIRAHIKEHGQPELIPELYQDRIDRNEYFEIVCEIDIDPLRRAEADLAPCPMCQPNKFLHGRLCWFPRLEACAIIGHCCANKEHSAAAERRFKEASVLKWQEDYFLAALPLVPEKLKILGAMTLKAEEAQRLHRKMRKDAKPLWMRLRDATKGGGRLQVNFEIEREATGTDGPRGFGRNKAVFDTREYGVLDGSVAIRAQYDPIGELEAMSSKLQVWNVGSPSEEVVIDAIVTMNQRQRDHGYAVLTNIDHNLFPRFKANIEDFERFFDPINIKRLNDWGDDPANTVKVQATLRPFNPELNQVQISGAGCYTSVVPGANLSFPVPDWPAVPKRRG